MTTATMTLTEFLLARIAEDEGSVREEELHTHLCVYNAADWMCDCNLRARVQAECEAKRLIVELHTPLEGEDCDPSCGDVETPCRTLRVLACIYADRPDHRAEWRA